MKHHIRHVVQAFLSMWEASAPALEWVLVETGANEFLGALRELTEISDGYLAELTHDTNRSLPLSDVEAQEVRTRIEGMATEAELAALQDLTKAGVREGGRAALLAAVRQTVELGELRFPMLTVCFDCRVLDPPAVRLIRFLMDDVVGRLMSQGVDRILVVESGKLQVDHHLPLAHDGARHRITTRITETSADFQSPPLLAEEQFRRLARRWEAADLICFFLGAGFSVSSLGMPLGNDMRDKALQELMESNESYEILAGRLYDHLEREAPRLGATGLIELDMVDGVHNRDHFIERLTLERVNYAARQRGRELTETLAWFEERNAQGVESPGLCVVTMWKLIEAALEHEKPVLIFTVNFDELIEPAFIGNEDRVKWRDEDLRTLPDLVAGALAREVSGPYYLKLHGTIGSKESLVVDYQQVFNNPNRLFGRAVAALAEAKVPMIYIGHSMRDYDVAADLAGFDNSRLDEHWVTPSGPDQVLQEFFSRQRNWEGPWRYRVTNATADTYLSSLWRQLEGAVAPADDEGVAG